MLYSACERIEVELSGNPSVAAELGVLVAESASRLGDLGLARQACDAALPRCILAFGQTHALTLQTRYLMMEAANERGDYKLAANIGPQLVADLRLKLPLHASLLVSSLREHSFELAKHELQAPSLATLQEAVEIAEQHLGPLHDETLTSIGLLSNTFTHFALHAESLPVAELAMQRARTAYGDLRPHTQLVSPERWYAAALNNCGRPADAEPIARRCVADQRLLDGENSIRVVNAMRVHASVLVGMGRWADSVQMAQQVRADQERLLPGDHIDAATGARALASAWWPTRRTDLIAPLLVEEEAMLARLNADTAAKTMARHRTRTFLAAWAGDLVAVQAESAIVLADSTPAFAYERARVTCAQSIVLQRLGRYSEALPLAEQALSLAQTEAPNLTPVHVSHAQEALGLALLELGQVDKAFTHLQMAEIELERGQVVPSVWYADSRLGQARVHILRGDHRVAQALLNEVEAWWAEANPGSVWHDEVKAWQTRASELPA